MPSAPSHGNVTFSARAQTNSPKGGLVELDQQNVDFLLKRSACQLKLKHLEGVHLTCGPVPCRLLLTVNY